MKARAMATRRLMPPERLAGYRAKGLLQLDKAERLVDAAVDLVVGNALLDQLVGHVVANGEGIEERALLEDHAGAGAEGKSRSSGMCEISSPKSRMLPSSGRSRPLTSLSRTLLPTPAGPSRMRVSPGRHGKADVLKNRRAIEGDGDVAKGYNGAPIRSRAGPDWAGWIRHWIRRVGSGWAGLTHAREEREQHLGEQEIDEDDEHRRDDHGLNGGAAHALGAPVVLMP